MIIRFTIDSQHLQWKPEDKGVNIFKVCDDSHSTTIAIPSKLIFQNEVKIKTFSKRQK